MLELLVECHFSKVEREIKSILDQEYSQKTKNS